jgi:SOS response regulatory protein OraA/RecX
VPPADPPAAASAEAVRYLARAARSSAEVADHLTRRRFAPELIEATILALTRRGYLDDAALAERRAEELLVRRGFGRLRVAHELTRRGLTDTVIDRAIAGVLESQSEVALGRAALARRFRDVDRSSRHERARAFRFLLGRGHPPDVVNEILGEEF